jgi:hypothetical protein
MLTYLFKKLSEHKMITHPMKFHKIKEPNKTVFWQTPLFPGFSLSIFVYLFFLVTRFLRVVPKNGQTPLLTQELFVYDTLLF